MNYEVKISDLKKTVIKFLRTCENHRFLSENFWNAITKYQKKNVAAKYYGVSKMQVLLERFKDVIIVDKGYIILRSEFLENELIVISDSDESDHSNTNEKKMSQSREKTNHKSKTTSVLNRHAVFRERLLSLLKANNGQCNIWKFLDCYASTYGRDDDVSTQLQFHSDIVTVREDVIILNPQVTQSANAASQRQSSSSKTGLQTWGQGATLHGSKGVRTVFTDSDDESDSDIETKSIQSQNSSTSNLTGFIPFSGVTSNQGLSAHQRYGLPSEKQLGGAAPGNTFPTQAMPFLRMPTSSSYATNSMPIGLAAYSMGGVVAQSLKTAYASPQLVVTPQQPMSLPGTLHNPMSMDNLNLSLQQLGSFKVKPAEEVLAKSEWPVPRLKSGPPPGTKMTDDVKEVIVRPITRGSRLTSVQVNSQIKECIDILCEAKEHVSMERVETLLLQKFGVRHFRDLNLQERNFSFLPAARDHSLLLGKVNVYIQNFVRSRSLCTLYELQECCREFHPSKQEFEHLKLGPMQKMPMIHEFFKFPHDEYVPEITSVDLMEHLNKFLTKFNKWSQQTSVDEFMQYLVEAYHVESAFSLGIRIRSLPLAIQMMKKSQRDAAAARKKVIDTLREMLEIDIQDAFRAFRASILQNSNKGNELRIHYLNLNPEVAIQEIFTKFELLAPLFSANAAYFKKIQKMLKHFKQFVKNILEVTLPRQLFHLAVCMSNVELEECATEVLEVEAKQQQLKQEASLMQQQQQTSKKVPPTKVTLTEKVSQYVNKCLEQGALKLAHLQRIETRILEDLDFSSFQDMGYGTFLDFIHSEQKIKTVLEESGGTLLGSGSEHESVYRPSHLELLEFLCQAKFAGLSQMQAVDTSLCEQYLVNDVRHLGHGNIVRLSSTADKPGKHHCTEYNVLFEAALCGKMCHSTHIKGHVGLQGSVSKEAAMACLTACPLLEDLEEWSNWPLVFQPQHGRLKDFIKKYGGLTRISLEGGKKIALSDFKALEVEPGKLLKVNTCTSIEKFAHALDRDDPFDAAGQLVSLIVANKGLENTPLALVTNHLKTKLISLHALSTSTFTPGGPPTADTVDLAVQFVTEILLRLPVRICIAIANQVLLEPLNQVVGSAKSKHQIKQACKLPIHRRQLEVLGCLLGLQEWASTIQDKFVFPSHCIEETLADELLGSADSIEDEEVVEEEDEEEEDESDSEDSDIDEMLDVNEDKVDDSVTSANKENDETGIEKELEPSQIDRDKINAASGEEKAEGRNVEEDSLIKDPCADLNNGDSMINESNEKCGTAEKDRANITSNEESQCEVEINDNEELTEEIVNANDQTEGIVEERELTQEEKCRLIVDDIRREEFGVGIKLDETGQKLMIKQQERQGRSLQRLSKDLYSKETHFVLELIQNADDNSYSDEVTPSIKFVIDLTGVRVMNNELGFEDKNVRAICDVGKSTKSKHKFGYIGQKGIGFKSVFRMTSCPEVHSNGFHIYFDVNSGPMGYILPHWKENFESDENWQTQILLPWTEDIKQQVHTHAARFNDIQPSLLLFLHRLKEIRIENKVESSEMFMCRQDFENGEVQITHSHGTDKWLVLRKLLDASNISLQAKSGVEVESTEIALAFPLRNKKLSMNTQIIKPEKLPVFAFLPLRSYGFRFIVQGDFDVPSSREDVDRDSFWNQWLRSQIHLLFIEALEAFKARADWTPVEALIQYLQFIPLEGEVMGFFKPVATQILDQLKAKECMPVLTADKKTVRWKMPSKTVITRDSLILEIVSPEVLQQHLDLSYLHPDVAAILNEPLTQALGIESITTEHLLHIGRSLAQYWESSDHVVDIAKWLACVYRSLDDFQDNTEVVKELQKMRIIPLSCCSLVSLSDITVFMLTDSQDTQSQSVKSKKQGASTDPLLNLKKDLNLVHSDLTSTSDNEVNSQVVKLLLKLGIKQLTAHDLIYSHILPVFKSDAWKDKKKEVIISYLVYIKSELDKNPSVVDRSELSVVKLVTNHGIISPIEDVHFPIEYGNGINLKQTFPGFDWTFVDLSYLPSPLSAQDRQSWHKFLAELGVVDFLKVTKVEKSFDKSNIHETSWSSMKDVWPDSADGYTITDFQCEEFHKLVTANQIPEELIPQMVKLFEYLDARWNTEYKNHTFTQLKSGSGHLLKDAIHSSFAVHLKSLSWVPAICSSVSYDEDTKTVDTQVSQSLQHSVDLYFPDQSIRRLLHHTVKYLNVVPQENSLSKFLEIKLNVSEETLTESLMSWGNRTEDSPDKPRIFCTAKWHMFEIYKYLGNEMKPRECQALFHEYPVIFVPIPEQNVKGGDMLAGWMMKRDEVWWSDPTGLFTKYMKSLVTYNSPLGKFKILSDTYSHLEDFFSKTARIDQEPSTMHYAQLLKHIATVCSLAEEGVLYDTMCLFTKIGNDLSKISSIVAHVKTIEAMKAESNLPKVTELLLKSAVFPTKSGQWVSLSDSPMISDSKEYEEMFSKKPGVHLLRLDVQDNTGNIDPKCVDYFIHLFKEIKPLSECIKTEEITSLFKQCNKGQTYLHNIVGPVQRYLYSAFPGVYRQFKAKKSGSLKELIFSQVERLQVRYDLAHLPDVFVIKEERCVVTDKCFYFHEKFVDNHFEINKELARYFSEGDEKCMRELRNFLIEADFIFENRYKGTIEDLLNSLTSSNSTLPHDEEVWEVPLPIIPVTPEPEPTFMVYDQQASSSENFIPFKPEEQESQGLKSWPPKSAVDKEEGNRIKRDPNKAPSLWPPPQGASGPRNVSKLPSNIKFENPPSEIELSTREDTKSPRDDSHVSYESKGGQGTSRQSSQSNEERHVTGHLTTRQVSYDHEGKRISRAEQGQQVGDQPKQSNSEESSSPGHHKDDRPSWVGPATVSGRDPKSPNDANQELSQSGDMLSRNDSNGERENVMTGKRKLTGNSQDDNFIALKRVNSQEEPVQEHQSQEDHVTDVNRDASPSVGSGREATPSRTNEERKKSGKHRGMLHFTIPNWNEYNEDLLYSELAHAESLALPQLTLQQGAQEKEIGLWGEQLVFNYLQHQRESNSNIHSVVWVNATGEMGLPFDFEIVYKTPDPEKTTSLYVEVKTTVSKDKEVFHVSSNQMEFALAQKNQYEIYRVYGAGSPTARLVRIENVSEKMRVKQIQLFMVI